MDHEARIAHALQVGAHAVGVQPELPRKLIGRRRSAEVAEEREEPPARGLDERVVVPVQVGKVNGNQFSHLGGRNP
jgi:hypothetical protein